MRLTSTEIGTVGILQRCVGCYTHPLWEGTVCKLNTGGNRLILSWLMYLSISCYIPFDFLNITRHPLLTFYVKYFFFIVWAALRYTGGLQLVVWELEPECSPQPRIPSYSFLMQWFVLPMVSIEHLLCPGPVLRTGTTELHFSTYQV